jgi:myo-inositol-1(or 4)-monophosphatase
LRASDAIDRAALSRHLAATVREAGALALGKFRTTLRHWSKEGGSPVTEADIAVDELLRERLAGVVADCGWFSEESHDDARLTARRLWVVDPIDGTRAYMEERPDWSIAVALVEDGRPVIAAVFAPVEDALFAATIGTGATLNGAPIAVTDGTSLAGARAAGPGRHVDRLTELADVVAVPRIYSLALRLARLAQGKIDIAVASGSSHDWDLAAADLLVHEAGGVMTTLDGLALTYNRAVPVHGALVAAGPARHARLIEVLRTRQAEFA